MLVEQHNPAMADIAAGLTNSLARDGRGGMLGPLNMNGNLVSDLEDGVLDTDAATVKQMRTAVQGPPGGNVMSTGPMALVPTIPIPAGANLIKVDGRMQSSDRGAGREFVYDATLGQGYVPADPYHFVRDSNGRGFREVGTRTRAFYVEDYQGGNDTLGGADDTATFDRALYYALKLGDAKLIAPRGTFTTNIIVPFQDVNWLKTIGIAGIAAPAFNGGTVGTLPYAPTGTVLRPADQTKPVVQVQGANGGGFSFVNAVLKNLSISAYANPQSHGVDFGYAQNMRIEGVQIDTGVFGVQATEPTNVTRGLIAPVRGNGCAISTQNLLISGFGVGMEVNEHFENHGSTGVMECKIAVLTGDADHAINLGSLLIQRCQGGIKINGVSRGSADQVRFEHANANQITPATAWQQTQFDVQVTGIGAQWTIPYAVVLGNVSGEPDPTLPGGQFLFGTIAPGDLSGVDVHPVGRPRPFGVYPMPSASQSIPTGVVTPITLTTSGFKMPGWLPDPNDATKFACSIPGTYRAEFDVRFASNATGSREIAIYKFSAGNQSTVGDAAFAANPSTGTLFTTVASFTAIAGDEIQVVALQNSGASVNLDNTGAGVKLRISKL